LPNLSYFIIAMQAGFYWNCQFLERVSRLRVLNGYYYEKGVTLTYPEKLYEYSVDGHKLLIDALFYSEPNFKLQLGGRVIRFEITSPREGIIRMRVTHQKQDHQKQVKFPLRTEIFDNKMKMPGPIPI
jgi:hypothetical protein